MIHYISLSLSLVILIISAITDTKKGKIYNKVTMPAIAIGIILSFIVSLKTGLIAILSLIALFFLGMTKLFGMGDLKLLMALSSLLGIISSAIIFILSCLVFAIAVFFFKGASFLAQWTIWKEKIKDKTIRKLSKEKIRFAPYILAGFIVFEVVKFIKTGEL